MSAESSQKVYFLSEPASPSMNRDSNTVIVHTDCKLLSEAEIGLVRTKQVSVIDAIKTGRIATLVCSLFCVGSLQQSSWGTGVRTTPELSCPSETLSNDIPQPLVSGSQILRG